MINLSDITICKAIIEDAKTLTDISFAAKRHWNYPENYYDLWKDELTITNEYIHQHIVYKAQLADLTIGFYSIVEIKSDFYAGDIFVKKGFWMEHIFIRPEYHKFGIGSLLIDHARKTSKSMEIHSLLIFVDPYAKGFYEKIGANFLYESKSSIPNRLIPVYELEIC